MRARLELFDIAARNGIFLTATSGSDDHVGRDWLGSKQPFITSVWAGSRALSNLTDALARGRAWAHHLRAWPDGELDLRLDGRPVMGGVLTTAARQVELEIFTDVPAGARVHVITGACDRGGAVPSLDSRILSSDGPLSTGSNVAAAGTYGSRCTTATGS